MSNFMQDVFQMLSKLKKEGIYSKSTFDDISQELREEIMERKTIKAPPEIIARGLQHYHNYLISFITIDSLKNIYRLE